MLEEKEKEERKVEKAESVKPKPSIQKTYETKIRIPILKLEKPKIEIKEVSLSKNIPHIEKEKLEIKVPIIHLSPPVFEEKEIKINKEIPSVEVIEKKIKIPIVKLREVHVRSIIPSFNSVIPTVKPSPETRVRVPIYRILRIPRIKEIDFLDEKIDEKLLDRLEEVREQIPESQVSVTLGGAEPSGGEEEEFEEKPPEVIKFIWGSGSTNILSNGPFVILYKELEDDSTIGSFETICMRVFREKRGGEPGYFSIKKLDDFNIREIEKHIKPEGNIIRIDLDQIKKDTENKKEDISKYISSDRLKETLDKFIVGPVSFLIFKTRDENLYKYYKQVLKKLSANMEHPLKIIEVTPRKMTVEQKKILTELAWGVSVSDREFESDVMVIDDRPIGRTLDDILNKIGKRKHEDYLEKLGKEKGGIYSLATNQHEGEESDTHLQMKWFVVKFLAKEHELKSLQEIEEKIGTEEEILKGEHPKPDVWDKEENSVYEIETLFSEDREGRTPENKIYESIRKYEGTSVREINVVLDNLAFLIHLKELLGIKRNIKEWKNKTGKIVNFLTLDIKNNKLISINEVLRKCKSLNESKYK